MLPLALLATLSHAAQRPTVDVAFAALVPIDACAVLRVTSLDELDSVLRALAGDDGDPLIEDAQALLTGALEADLPFELVDRARPLGLACTLPPGAIEPTRTFLLPVSDVDAFTAALDELPASWIRASAQGYVALSDIEDYAPPATPSALTAQLAHDGIALRVDMERVMDAYAPMIELGMQEFRGSFKEDLEAAELALIGDLPDFVEELVDSLTRVDVTFALDGAEFRFELDCALDPGTALGAPAAGAHAFDARLAQRLLPGAALQFVSDYDTNWLDPLAQLALDEFEKSMRADLTDEPEEARTEAEAIFEALHRLRDELAAVGRRSAFALDFGDDGIAATLCLSSSDPGALARAHSELVAKSVRLLQDAPGVALGTSTERTIGGIAFTEMSIGLDTDLVEGDDADELMTELMLGADGLRLAMGTDARYFLLALDADDAALARLAGANDAVVDPLLDELAGASSAFWLRADVARLEDFGARIDAADAGVDRGPSTVDASTPLSLWGGVRGSIWFCGLSADRATLVRVVESLESADEEPEFDK